MRHCSLVRSRTPIWTHLGLLVHWNDSLELQSGNPHWWHSTWQWACKDLVRKLKLYFRSWQVVVTRWGNAIYWKRVMHLWELNAPGNAPVRQHHAFLELMVIYHHSAWLFVVSGCLIHNVCDASKQDVSTFFNTVFKIFILKVCKTRESSCVNARGIPPAV